MTRAVKVVVCICTRKREALLRDCLAEVKAAIDAHHADDDVAVQVVDNDAGGSGAAVVCELRANFPALLEPLVEERRGISFARNRAVGAALEQGAELIAFIDDDDVPDLDWLKRLLDRWRETRADLVFGRWRWPAGFGIRRWQQDIVLFTPPSGEVKNRHRFPRGAGTYNVLLHRSVAERLAPDGELFHAAFALTGGGDTDLFMRAGRAGMSTAVALDSLVVRRWGPERTSFMGVMRRAYRMGNSRAWDQKERRDPGSRRMLRRRVTWRFFRHLLLAPFLLPIPRRFGANAYEVAWSMGGIAAWWFGIRFRYYTGTEAAAAAAADRAKRSS